MSSIERASRQRGRRPAPLVPAAAEDPLARLRLRALVDAPRELGGRAGVLQIDVVELRAAVDEAHVRVVEPRRPAAALRRRRTVVFAPRQRSISSAPPTSTIRSPMTATAVADGCAGLPVQIVGVGDDEIGGEAGRTRAGDDGGRRQRSASRARRALPAANMSAESIACSRCTIRLTRPWTMASSSGRSSPAMKGETCMMQAESRPSSPRQARTGSQPGSEPRVRGGAERHAHDHRRNASKATGRRTGCVGFRTHAAAGNGAHGRRSPHRARRGPVEDPDATSARARVERRALVVPLLDRSVRGDGGADRVTCCDWPGAETL